VGEAAVLNPIRKGSPRNSQELLDTAFAPRKLLFGSSFNMNGKLF
jgi:hypothetical protein